MTTERRTISRAAVRLTSCAPCSAYASWAPGAVSWSQQARSGRTRLVQGQLLDRVARDAPRPQLVQLQPVDDERLAAPEPGQLAVGARRNGRRLRMRVEDGELEAVVLEEPHLGIDVELVPVRRRELVPAAHVPLRDAVAEDDHAAALVRRLLGGVRMELLPDGRRNHHQSVASIDSSTSASAALQNGAERYFQPPSARTQATVEPSGSSSAIRRATWTTAPDETPAKIPSRSRSARTAITDDWFETSSLRSSCETSRIGGTYPSSSDRRPITGSPGSGSAATTIASGFASRTRRPVPISVPPVPRPATTA